MHELPKILIIDDTPNNIQFLHQTLQDKYEVFFATSGKKGIDLAKIKQPNLILLDIMMPEINGYDVCKQLKIEDTTKAIPIIFLSALDEVNDKVTAFEVGGVDYINKPFQPIEVLARIENQLRIQSLQKELLSKNNQLDQQNIQLRQAARLRDDIEHITRHDLKSPLHSIIGLSRVIKEEKNLTKEQIEMLTMLEDSGYRMLNMINTSLDLYKMESGTYLFKAKSVDLISVFKHVLKDLSILIDTKKITVLIYKQNNIAIENHEQFIIQGEEILCYSLFLNLVKNALEASPKEDKVILKILKEDKSAVIKIYNKGEVSDKIRDKLFEKNVTYGKVSGVGLGTYSAKLMVEVQQGKIHFDGSEPGATTISVILPA